MLDFEEFKSYKKIMDPKILNSAYKTEANFMKILDMYNYCNGLDLPFTDSLSMSKFSKLISFFGGNLGDKNVTKFDMDVVYKKMTSVHEKINIKAFFESVLILLESSYKSDSKFNNS